MTTNEDMKYLIKAAASAGISMGEAALALKNIPSLPPTYTHSEPMTTEEMLQFCKEHEAEIWTSYDFTTDTYTLKMRKGQAAATFNISAMDIIESKSIPLRSILARMADEIDALPPRASET